MMVSVTAVDYDPFSGGAVPQSGRALLDTIAGSESPGYNTLYGGGQFEGYADHPRQAVPITSGPNAGKTSSAAGRYQFLGSTWDEVKKEAGLTDFSPDSQDRGAWHLANKIYKAKTGRDLETELTNAKDNPAAIQGIGRMLSGVWTSLPGGIEPNKATGSFTQRYASANMPTDVSAQSKRPTVTAVDYDPFASASQGAGERPPDSNPSPDNGGRFTDTAGENFRTAREGASPPTASAGQAFGTGAIKGATLNWADELVGTLAAGGFDFQNPAAIKNATSLIAGLYKRVTGDQDADAAYRVASSAIREGFDRHREQQPAASIGGEIAGALATAPLLGGGGGAAGLGARTLQGAKIGAGYGAVSGAGEGQGLADRTEKAIGGGIVGGLTGGAANAVLPPVLSAVARPFTKDATAAAVPTAQELKAAAAKGFQSPEVTGLSVAPTALRDFSQKVGAEINQLGIDEILAPKTFAILGKLDQIPPGAAVTGQNLQTLRRTFQAAAGSPDKTERLAAKKVIDAIDDFIPNVAAKDIISGDPQAAAKAWQLARGDYAAAMRSEDIAKAVLKATRQAESAGSGGNIDNATRQQFKAILNNDKRLRGFNAEEVDQMEAIVKGTTWGNRMRLGGKAAPTGIVSGGIGSGAGYAAGGPIGAVLVPLAGWLAKKAGDRSTANQVAKLDELVRSRAPLANTMQTAAQKLAAFNNNQSASTFAAAMLASRNLSNNLKDAGITISPTEIMRSLQGGAQKAAADDQQQ